MYLLKLWCLEMLRFSSFENEVQQFCNQHLKLEILPEFQSKIANLTVILKVKHSLFM